jgi:hypothetical protein
VLIELELKHLTRSACTDPCYRKKASRTALRAVPSIPGVHTCCAGRTRVEVRAIGTAGIARHTELPVEAETYTTGAGPGGQDG